MTIQRQTSRVSEETQARRIGTFLFIVVIVGALFSLGRSMVVHHFFDGDTQIQEYERADSDSR